MSKWNNRSFHLAPDVFRTESPRTRKKWARPSGPCSVARPNHRRHITGVIVAAKTCPESDGRWRFGGRFFFATFFLKVHVRPNSAVSYFAYKLLHRETLSPFTKHKSSFTLSYPGWIERVGGAACWQQSYLLPHKKSGSVGRKGFLDQSDMSCKEVAPKVSHY